MGDRMKNKSTEKLLNRLKGIRNREELEEYIDSSSSIASNYKLTEYILDICEKKGLGKSDIIKNADIHRTYGYQILNGKRGPSRDKLLQLCIGNRFNLEETNRALTLAKLGVLYAKDPRDSIVIFILNNNLGLIDGNILLNENGFKPFSSV